MIFGTALAFNLIFNKYTRQLKLAAVYIVFRCYFKLYIECTPIFIYDKSLDFPYASAFQVIAVPLAIGTPNLLNYWLIFGSEKGNAKITHTLEL